MAWDYGQFTLILTHKKPLILTPNSVGQRKPIAFAVLHLLQPLVHMPSTTCFNYWFVTARAVQKLLEKLTTQQKISLFMSALSIGAVTLSKDLNGHCVIQYCLKNFSDEDNKEKFDLQGKVEDSNILSHVGKLRKEFKSTLKTRYYKEMVQEAQSEKVKESRTKVSYAHIAGSTRYATLNAQFAEKEGRDPSRLEQFRFQHLRKYGSDKLSSEAAEQVYDEACKMVKDSMPTPESSFIPQDNIALENEAYTQVFGLDNNGKMLGYGCGITKSKLFGYGSVTRGSQYTSAISTLIEEMSAKHVEQIQTIQAEQAIREKTLP
ncbi:hypothetical protein GOBAR_AA27807 [Gossypium barbadense]|uniref:Uncharacterized protein n=1 Tax=Gossypium barbadense TaxID=3634 RepID=A0A2P5WP69_GOSBA|nr:hypothetical protein GOBAR_AA27807 [Gossypium barbadense]